MMAKTLCPLFTTMISHADKLIAAGTSLVGWMYGRVQVTCPFPEIDSV